jgi:ribosomal protein S18 acetylase RimI-like enzyme
MKKAQRPLIELLAWDTAFFKHSIARLNRSTFRANELRTAFSECAKRGIECLYARVGQLQRERALAKKFGFTPVGTRATYELRSSRAIQQLTNGVVAFASKKDHAAILRLAEGLSEESRFSRDKRFGRAAARALYRKKWAKKFLVNPSRTSRVVVAHSRGRVAGFIASSVQEGIVRIELVVVGRAFRGRGMGGALVDATIASHRKNGRTRFRVATQGTNLAARRLYESRGFRLLRSELDYHKWFARV